LDDLLMLVRAKRYRDSGRRAAGLVDAVNTEMNPLGALAEFPPRWAVTDARCAGRTGLMRAVLLLLLLLSVGCEAENDPTLPPENAPTPAVMSATRDPAAADATARLTDREVLEIFYHATGGPNWVGGTNTNWLTDAPLGEWHGVETDEQGRVRVLRLYSSASLSGSIPPEIGNLSHLTELSLRGTSLTGPLPPELGDLNNLTDLRLNGVSLGPLPPELGNLRGLTKLNLRGVSGPLPPEIGNLDNLTELYLRGLTGLIPPEIGNLSNLHKLELSGSFGSIPPEIGNLDNLEWLYLNGFSGDPLPLETGDLANLTGLRLSRGDPSGPIPPAIGNLNNLERLHLSDFSGPIPREISNLANLEHLNLYGNHFSSPIPAELGNLTNLHVLYLQANDLKGPIPPELGNLARLEYLFLENNDLSGPVPAGLSGMSNLVYLVLTNNPRMAGSLPVEITRIRWLQTLMAEGIDVCAPADASVRKWLRKLRTSRVKPCVNGNLPAYLVQAVQSREFPVPLVAGRKALLRVFPTATQATDIAIPGVEAHFFHEGRKVFVMYIPSKSEPIPTYVDEDSLTWSANAEIPGDIIQPGLEMVIEIDPDGTLDPELLVSKRIPETGRYAVEVHEMGLFDLRLIPFVWTETYDSSRVELVRAVAADPENHRALQTARRLLPIGSMKVTAYEPVLSSSNDAQSLLRETYAVRAMDWGQEEGVSKRYYMGILPPGFSGNYAGMAQGMVSVSSTSPYTIAHELGHNMDLGHAPCGRNTGGRDGWYPYSDGKGTIRMTCDFKSGV